MLITATVSTTSTTSTGSSAAKSYAYNKYLKSESCDRGTVSLVSEATRHWVEGVRAVDVERIPLPDGLRVALTRRPHALQAVRPATPLHRRVHSELSSGAVVVRGLRRLAVRATLGLYPFYWPESRGRVGDHDLPTVGDWGGYKVSLGPGLIITIIISGERYKF